ncbi:MAG: hypothetical protein AAGU11_11395 [Syntrophobacteraceae bacterium]
MRRPKTGAAEATGFNDMESIPIRSLREACFSGTRIGSRLMLLFVRMPTVNNSDTPAFNCTVGKATSIPLFTAGRGAARSSFS